MGGKWRQTTIGELLDLTAPAALDLPQQSEERAQLQRMHGATLATPGGRPTHTSWWPAADLDGSRRAQCFAVVAEVTQ